ncbi:hypothetical protein OPQ81_000113 [Rhizoctonia solani]|nr:hypothetical protein OPQ81_000113 [Rhizoctonia solani]
MKFFSSSKRPTKKSHPEDQKYQDHDLRRDRSREDDLHYHSHSESIPSAKSPLKSLHKPASPPTFAASSSSSSSTAAAAAAAAAAAESKRSSRRFSRVSSDLGKSSSSSRRNKVDHDTHPLNLPTRRDQEALRPISHERGDSVDRMDVDPPGATSAPASPSQRRSSPPAADRTPAQTPPPATNGASSPKKEDAPAPPPPHERSEQPPSHAG